MGININTKTEEIALLKQKIDLSKSSDDGKLKAVSLENESLNEVIVKQQKQIKKLKDELETEEENIEKVEKEKRKLKSALSSKDGEITILTHKLELEQQRKDLDSSSENDQIKKLKENNQELDDENMKKTLQIKKLKEDIANLTDDIHKEKEHVIALKTMVEAEKSSTENEAKLKEMEKIKYEEQINGLELEKQ